MSSRDLSQTASGVRSGEASAFTLDTSGAVPMGRGENIGLAGVNLRWSDLSPFAQGYVEAAARELYERLLAAFRAEQRANPSMDARVKVAFSRWAPETLAAILKDCEAGRNLSSGIVPTFRKNKLGGAAFWRQREAYGFPPLTPALNDAGRVVFA